MTDTPTTRIKLRKQSLGSNVNTWGDTKINDVLDTVDRVTNGYQSLAIIGDTTLSWTNYSATNDGQVETFKATASLSAAATLTVPSSEWSWAVFSNATGQTLTAKTSAGTGIAVPDSRQTQLYNDGTDVRSGAANWLSNYAVSPLNNGDVIVKVTMESAITTAINAASTGLSGGFASNFFYTATGGETSKSGVDDNGATLAYTPGTATEVFLNGVKLIPVSDYVATTGTSVTGLTALSAGDILHVRAWAVFSAAGTYTQAQTNALFASPPIGIGSTTPTTGAFTTLTASSTVSGAGYTARFASPGPIGSTAASTGAFTTLSASSTISGAGFTAYLASPPAIGGTAPAALSGTNIQTRVDATNSAYTDTRCFRLGNTITTWTTILTITPATVTSVFTGGIVEMIIAGDTGVAGNGATKIAWYFSISNGAPTVAAMLASPLYTAGTPGQGRLNVSGNTIQVQIQSNDATHTIGGMVEVKSILPTPSGTATTFTLS